MMMNETSENTSPSAESPKPESGFTYRIVTRYWPRIAAVLVLVVGVLEWVIGGLTSNGKLEFYVFAWATMTAGLWFLFEKAEKALSEESRKAVVGKLQATDFQATSRSIPDQFALLFDRVFGEKHLSWHCFKRSALASLISVVLVAVLPVPGYGERILSNVGMTGAYIVAVLSLSVLSIANLLPDYLSLLQTRWMMGWARKQPSKTPFALGLDLFLTTVIAFVVWGSIHMAIEPLTMQRSDLQSLVEWEAAEGRIEELPDRVGTIFTVYYVWLIGFISTFFTSVWLWLYAASVPVSRVLVKMSGGVGFLLKITDVEKQPFRSMGFTSVLIVSVLFLIGLPFVLLG